MLMLVPYEREGPCPLCDDFLAVFNERNPCILRVKQGIRACPGFLRSPNLTDPMGLPRSKPRQVDLDQGLLDRALSSSVTLDDCRLERLQAQLR
jgi:hypothetical protein